MASPTAKTKETPAITPRQKFEGHADNVWGVIHLPGGQRIITCSHDGSLRVWNLKSGKQIGKDWRDGESKVDSTTLSSGGKKVVDGREIIDDRSVDHDGVWTITLSPDGKKVVSGSWDAAVRLWDINTCKVVAKWTGHTMFVGSACWSRDGRRVLSGSNDGTARQWGVESGEMRDVESGETILASIKTGHEFVWAVVYSPDMSLIATGGQGGLPEHSIQIWDTKTGKVVATLKGHTKEVRCLAWTDDGKTLVSGSYDHSIRTWNTTKWEQTAVLDEHTNYVFALAISPNGRILASASMDNTARLWNLDNGQLINGSSLQHAGPVNCVSFSAGGRLLATGCNDKNAYSWNVVAIVREAGLDELLSDSKVNKSALHASAARRPIQQRPPAGRVPHGFFDGVPPAHTSAPQETTLFGRLFHRSPSSTHDTSSSSPLDWARNLFKWRRQSGEEIELQGRSSAVFEVPYAKGKRRNASKREVALAKQKQKQKTKALHSKNSTAGSSQPPKLNVTKPPSQSQAAASSLFTTPATGDATEATTSTLPSRRHAMIKDAGLWTRVWLFLGCLSPEYMDDHH